VWDTLLVGAFAGIGVLIGGAFLAATSPIWAPIVAVVGGIVAVGAAIAAMFGYEYIKGKLSDAWESITGVFTGITDWWATVDLMTPLTGMWETVKGWFTFGEGESFSISAVGTKMWESVTGWFSMEGTDFSIAALGKVAWEAVTGWFSFLDTTFSISTIATDMWNTVTGWFGFGEGEAAYSISTLISEAWGKITGFFDFGEEGFSFSALATKAWETVTGFFSFDNFQFPSITGLFDNVWEKLTGFFDFDFELPSFKSFLPSWMGGGDESNDITVDASPATDGANALMNAQTAMASFSNIEGLENNLNAIKNGLDIDGVTSYTEAMQKLVEVLGELNAELNKDNYTGYGNGTNAGTVVDKMQTIGSGGGGSNEELNNTMQQVLAVLSSIRTGTDLTANNTRNIVGSNLARSSVSNIG
jgi:hypothetical protein